MVLDDPAQLNKCSASLQEGILINYPFPKFICDPTSSDVWPYV
jgi:hypothetical protein